MGHVLVFLIYRESLSIVVLLLYFFLVESIGLEHALYTESKVTFRPSRPLRVTKDYRSNTWLSSSL